jgi:hypothetical protein
MNSMVIVHSYVSLAEGNIIHLPAIGCEDEDG